MDEVMTFTEFLQWVANPAGLAAIGVAISLAVRNMKWFESLSKQRKSAYIVVICVVILPLVLIVIPSYLPATAIAVIEPIFNALSLGAVAYMGSQGAHELWNKRVVEGSILPVSEEPLTGFGGVVEKDAAYSWGRDLNMKAPVSENIEPVPYPVNNPETTVPEHLETPSEGL